MDVEHVGLLSFISSSVSLRFDGNWLPVAWFHLPWVAHIPRFAYHKLHCHRGLEACHSPSFSNIWLMTMMRKTFGWFPFLSSCHYPSVAGHSCWSWLPVNCLTLPQFSTSGYDWQCDRYLSFYIPCSYLLDDLVVLAVCVCLSWLDLTRWLADTLQYSFLGSWC